MTVLNFIIWIGKLNITGCIAGDWTIIRSGTRGLVESSKADLEKLLKDGNVLTSLK